MQEPGSGSHYPLYSNRRNALEAAGEVLVARPRINAGNQKYVRMELQGLQKIIRSRCTMSAGKKSKL
jgi:hypothetical protein